MLGACLFLPALENKGAAGAEPVLGSFAAARVAQLAAIEPVRQGGSFAAAWVAQLVAIAPVRQEGSGNDPVHQGDSFAAAEAARVVTNLFEVLVPVPDEPAAPVGCPERIAASKPGLFLRKPLFFEVFEALHPTCFLGAYARNFFLALSLCLVNHLVSLIVHLIKHLALFF